MIWWSEFINSARLISLEFKEMLELLDASKIVCF